MINYANLQRGVISGGGHQCSDAAVADTPFPVKWRPLLQLVYKLILLIFLILQRVSL